MSRSIPSRFVFQNPERGNRYSPSNITGKADVSPPLCETIGLGRKTRAPVGISSPIIKRLVGPLTPDGNSTLLYFVPPSSPISLSLYKRRNFTLSRLRANQIR